MADKYANFTALAAGETAGLDYTICLSDRGTDVVVIAPHAGWIEPGSSQIASAIARDDHSIYLFEGLIEGRPHDDLHITSARFDEPRALALVQAAETAVAIHGRSDQGYPDTVWMGGRATAFRNAVGAALAGAGFSMITTGHPLPGRERRNICNRGASKAGVQLEIPRTLRNQLVGDRTKLAAFADAVREAITDR
jgi:phage replication-related protein YjqB (UPF0714/DUF867 family)